MGLRTIRAFSAAALIILTVTPFAWAQATAQLNGRVTDESGAVLPGVSVTVTQTDTGFTRTVVTDGEGAYVMPNLPTGPYRLEVTLQGFRTYVQTGIVLQVGATPTINAALAVGNLEETVSVEAAAPLVDVRSAGFNWGNPVTNFNSGTFGRILTQEGLPRIMQFGVKYGF